MPKMAEGSEGPRKTDPATRKYRVDVRWEMSGYLEIEVDSPDEARDRVLADFYGDVDHEGHECLPAGDYEKSSFEVVSVAALYPLPSELEAVWVEMDSLKRHPRFWETYELLDPRDAEGFMNLMHIPRRWLADGRERQVEEAMAAIRNAIADLPCPATGLKCQERRRQGQRH